MSILNETKMAPNITDLLVQIEELRRVQQELVEYREYTNWNLDHFYRMCLAIIVFLMQGGFAMMEAGSVRSKNTANILIKNLLDSFIAGFAYWLFGYAFAIGEGNTFIGYQYFAHYNMDISQYSLWFFHYVFAATAATIVSGSVAERCDFMAYLIYSSVITGFIYPVLVHWAWTAEGWLAKGFTYDNNGEILNIVYRDFSGSGIVHMLSGLAAFVGAKALGPRIGRYDEETGKPREIRGHSLVLSALGGFILLMGFLAFNASASGTLSGKGQGERISKIVVNTIMSGSSGGLVAMCAICGCVNDVPTFVAVIIGAIGGAGYMLFSWFVLNKCKVDDPLDAIPVHFGGGFIGVIAVAFFSETVGIFYNWNVESGLTLLWQCVGLAVVIAWTGGTCGIMFYTLKALKILRVSPEYELKGIDIPKHGETVYPPEAYGNKWGTEIHNTTEILSGEKTNGVSEPRNRKQMEIMSVSNGSLESEVTTITRM